MKVVRGSSIAARAPAPLISSPMKMLARVLFLRAVLRRMVALRIGLTWKIMLAFRPEKDRGTPAPRAAAGAGRRGRAHSSRPTECALSPLLETHGIARGHDANAVLELHENGTEATRAGDDAAGGALPLRKPGPPVPDVVIVLGHPA